VIKFVGIDLAKRSFHLYAVDGEGRAVLSRARLSAVVAQLPTCTIAMEACGSAHHWARLFRTFGHEVRLIRAQNLAGESKRDYRPTHAKPVVDAFFDWVEGQLVHAAVLPSNPLNKALHYALERR
jgi:hypothetical protein